MDFLGLRNLTVLDDAVQLVRKTQPDFDIEKVPDDVFSKKILGDGVAIIPENGKIVVPTDTLTKEYLERYKENKTAENMNLIKAVKITIKNALNLIGVEPPEKM